MTRRKKTNPVLSTCNLTLLPLHHKALTPENGQFLFNKDNKKYTI